MAVPVAYALKTKWAKKSGFLKRTNRHPRPAGPSHSAPGMVEEDLVEPPPEVNGDTIDWRAFAVDSYFEDLWMWSDPPVAANPDGHRDAPGVLASAGQDGTITVRSTGVELPDVGSAEEGGCGLRALSAGRDHREAGVIGRESY